MTTFWLQLRLLATILTLVAFVVAASDSPGECMDSSNNTIPDNADYQSSNHLPLIVVTNGSANEGYWSVFYLLSTGRVRVRSTVRNLQSTNAQKLINLEVHGRRAEVVEASNDDKDALSLAFQGAEGIYATTLYNVDMKKKFDPDNIEELESGRAIIAAAQSNSKALKHFLFQTMMRFKTHPPDLGLPIPIHYKTKYELEEEIRNAEPKLPWTFLRQPAYMRQVRFLLKGKHQLSSTHPADSSIGFVEEEDIGKLVAAILAPSDNTTTYLGQTINGISELAKPTDMIERFKSVIPNFSPHYKQMSPMFAKYLFKFLAKVVGGPIFPYLEAIFVNFGVGNALDMDMNDVKKCQEMTEEFGGLTTFEEWLEKYKTEKPHGDKRDIMLQTNFQKKFQKKNNGGGKGAMYFDQIKQLLTF